MAVSFANATTVVEANAANATYTAPASIVDGDLLLIWHLEFLAGGAPSATPPGGFNVVPGGTWPYTLASPSDFTQFFWYKIASGESGDYTVTHTACIRRGIMAHITGNDATTPFSPNPTRNGNSFASAGSTTTFTGLTPGVDNELILVFASDDNDAGGNLTAPGGTTPTFSERVDIGGEYLATGVLASAGPTGNKTMTNNSTGGLGFFSSMVAVQPSAGAPPTPDPATYRLITTPRLV